MLCSYARHTIRESGREKRISHFATYTRPFPQMLIVPIRIRESGREERTSPVKVTVSIEADSSSASRQQQMLFLLTDEADPFFLYTLRVTEEEFQLLKSDQSILIDFSDFPFKFLELLNSCVVAAVDDSPKFSACLSSVGDCAHLSIVETNQFKNLTHLKLEFRCDSQPCKHAREMRHTSGWMIILGVFLTTAVKSN